MSDLKTAGRRNPEKRKQRYNKEQHLRPQETQEATALLPASPSPPGSCPSPGCWCRGWVSQSTRWGTRRLPDRPVGQRGSCNTPGVELCVS